MTVHLIVPSTRLEILGPDSRATVTLRETVEQAFLEVLRAEARRQEIEELTSMATLDLADQEVMSGAWRS